MIYEPTPGIMAYIWAELYLDYASVLPKVRSYGLPVIISLSPEGT